MTAEIAILNKNGVALAADSTGTMKLSDGDSRFFTVEKLFSVSQNPPIAAMIYDNSDFTEIPCETIIKIYKSYIKDSNLDSLQSYVDYFFKFLMYDKRIYNFDYEKKLVKSAMDQCLLNVPRFNSRHSQNRITRNAVENQIKEFSDKPFLYDLDDNFIQLFVKTHGEYLKQYISEYSNIKFDKKAQENMVLLCAYTISKSDFLIKNKPSTGIVFAGYGSKDIFPSLFEYKITGVICNKLIYNFINKAAVGMTNLNVESTFIPFAQKDVVDTYTKGIDPQLSDIIFGNISSIFNNLFEEIQNESDNSFTHEFSNEEKAIVNRAGKKLYDRILKNFKDLQKKNYTDPFSTMVNYLGKEELVFLAEALVNLTSTRRRFTPDEESVGGSIDVVLITKADGLVWVKNK